MKKYLFKILILSSLAFCFYSSVCFATNPTFEVVPVGGTSYPTVSNFTVTQTSGYVVIDADATDISGVLDMTAVIRNSSNEVMNGNGSGTIMQPVGAGETETSCEHPGVLCSYEATVDISDPSVYPNGKYSVEVVAEDNLFQTSANIAPTYIKNFTIGPALPTNTTLWSKQTPSVWGTQYSNFGDPYDSWWSSTRAQFIILASDLTAANLQAGDTITAMYLEGGTYAPDRDLGNFLIRTQLTTETVTTSWETGWTNFFGPETVSKSDIVPGSWYKYDSENGGLVWDGTSNILVDISRNIGSSANDGVAGGIYVINDVSGTNNDRMFDWYCDNCDMSSYSPTSNPTYGAVSDSVPALELDYMQ